jgi:hypothetical protein
MKLHAQWVAVRNAGLILALCLLAIAEVGSAADSKEIVLPDSEYPLLLKRLITDGIEKSLKAKGGPTEEGIEKARTAAAMIAVLAQQNLDGPDGQQRATVRDAALKLMATIKAEKYADAIKQAQALPSLKPDANAKKERIKLVGPHVSYAELMHQFRPLKGGGWAIYGHLQTLQTKMEPLLPAGEVNEKFVLECYQIATMADAAIRDNYKHKVKDKEVIQHLHDMRKSAAELAVVLRGKDKTKAREDAPPVLSRLTTTCFSCHKTIRDSNKN